MANIFNLLAPKERKFFPMFENASSNLVEASHALCEMMKSTSPDQRKAYMKKIEDLEHKGDSITHEILDHLSRTFITPFDREDIHELTTVMDDILDFIHGASKRIDLYNVSNLTQEMIMLADLIEKGSIELDKAIGNLKQLKNRTQIHEACVAINSIENHADDIFNLAMAKLFNEETNPITVIKYKDVLAALETATDKCEDAADVVKTILIKHS